MNCRVELNKAINKLVALKCSEAVGKLMNVFRISDLCAREGLEVNYDELRLKMQLKSLPFSIDQSNKIVKWNFRWKHFQFLLLFSDNWW